MGYPRNFPGTPHPTRAFGAPPPPPPGGVGSAWRYQVGSRARGAAGGQPCPVFLQDLPMCWTVVDIATGGGADGEGELVPPPLSPTLQIPYFPGTPHPTRAFGAPPPPPSGAWAVRGDIRRAAVSGVQPVGHCIRSFPRISPCTGPWWISPWGVGLTGRGNSFPLPCLLRSQNSEYLTDPI